MNYEYIKDHENPFILEKETGFYVRIDRFNISIIGVVKSAVRNKNDYEIEISIKAYERIEAWIKENHPEFCI